MNDALFGCRDHFLAVVAKRFRVLAKLTCVLIAVFLNAPVHAGPVLDGIKSRGFIRCGVSEGIPGFSEKNSANVWQGIDVDFCRAVAAATLGDATKIQFVPLKSSNRFPALASQQIDLLVRNTTWTLSRETLFKLQFPGVLLYDGQGFMVARSENIKSIADLSGSVVCVEKGTTGHQHLIDYFAARGWKVTPLVIDSAAEVANAFFSGRCRAYTADASQLAAMQTHAPAGSQNFVILPERISKEPLGPVVPNSDREWTMIVRWVLIALIAAEEQGVTRANVDDFFKQPSTTKNNYFVGAQDPQVVKSLGIPAQWIRLAVGAAGNYGEMYDRNFGPGSPIPIERGLNRLWTNGGLHYAPPFN